MPHFPKIRIHEKGPTAPPRRLVVDLSRPADPEGPPASRVIVAAYPRGAREVPPLAILDSHTFALSSGDGRGAPELPAGGTMRLGAMLTLSAEDWRYFSGDDGRAVVWRARTTPRGITVEIVSIDIDGHAYYRAPVLP